LFQREPVWRPASAGRVTASAVARSWLEEPGSLTARLRSAVGDGFAVRLLGQKWVRPFATEDRLLDLPSRRRALVREVLLHCEGRPLVLARTVIPPRTLRGAHCGLANLGARPLGELLFSYRGLRRSHLQLARVDQTAWRHPVVREFGIDGPVWGRRSLYEVDQVSLLVCEFFLPNVLNLSEFGS